MRKNQIENTRIALLYALKSHTHLRFYICSWKNTPKIFSMWIDLLNSICEIDNEMAMFVNIDSNPIHKISLSLEIISRIDTSLPAVIFVVVVVGKTAVTRSWSRTDTQGIVSPTIRLWQISTELWDIRTEISLKKKLYFAVDFTFRGFSQHSSNLNLWTTENRRYMYLCFVDVFFSLSSLLSWKFKEKKKPTKEKKILYFPCMKCTQRPWFDFKLAKRVFSPSAVCVICYVRCLLYFYA